MMNTRTALPQLGDNILVVVENAPRFLDELRVVTASLLSLPTLPTPFFTLMACCPPRYWEHGGADNPDDRQEIEAAWKEEQADTLRAEHYLEQAKTVLEGLGVPAAHINTLIAVDDDDLLAATMHELTQTRLHYSGVIVSEQHDDIVNRLLKRGLTESQDAAAHGSEEHTSEL